MTQNPLHTIDLSTDTLTAGSAWYPTYAARAARIGARYGYNRRVTLAAFAALSPRLSLRANLHALLRCVAAHTDGRRMIDRSMPGKSASGVMGHRVNAAMRLLDGERSSRVLRSPKVRSFYLNLCGRESAVTVDTWAVRPFGYTGQESLNKRQYHEIAGAYRDAANKRGVSPSTLQAAVWIHTRGGGD